MLLGKAVVYGGGGAKLRVESGGCDPGRRARSRLPPGCYRALPAGGPVRRWMQRSAEARRVHSLLGDSADRRTRRPRWTRRLRPATRSAARCKPWALPWPPRNADSGRLPRRGRWPRSSAPSYSAAATRPWLLINPRSCATICSPSVAHGRRLPSRRRHGTGHLAVVEGALFSRGMANDAQHPTTIVGLPRVVTGLPDVPHSVLTHKFAVIPIQCVAQPLRPQLPR